jgi:cytochrome c peroxidase
MLRAAQDLDREGGARFAQAPFARVVCLVLLASGSVACGNANRSPVSVSSDDPPANPTSAELAALRDLSPNALPPPPVDSSNRFADDARAAKLGQRLFFDPSFAGELLDGDNDGTAEALGSKGDTGKVACAGCHVARTAFSDTRTIRHQISLAAGWGRRRAPSLLDVGHSKLLMWDGSRDSLQAQIFGVIESPVEMNSSRLFVAERVFAAHRDEYETVFGALPQLDEAARFPALSANETGCRKLDAENHCPEPMRGAPGDGAEYDQMAAEDQDSVTGVVVNVGKAIGAFERLLACGASRFDRWMAGDKGALSNAEQRGAVLFVGRAKCVDCHSGPYLSDEKFHNVGLRAALVATTFFNPDDPGASEGLPRAEEDPLNVRGKFSDGDDDRLPQAPIDESFRGAFRTPRLRCVAMRPSFMHTGQMLSLDDVVAFFSTGGDMGGYLGKNELHALDLSPRDQTDLVAFMQALDGDGPPAELLRAE